MTRPLPHEPRGQSSQFASWKSSFPQALADWRSSFIAAILVAAVLCCGCGGSLYDSPSASEKGPTITPSMLKKAEEFKAKKAAAKQKFDSKGKAVGARR
jgi:hypothetical protein